MLHDRLIRRYEKLLAKGKTIPLDLAVKLMNIGIILD